MARHTLEAVYDRHALVMCKGGNRWNPNTFWRIPTTEDWEPVAEAARGQGWRSVELDGDPSRVGSTKGPEDAVKEKVAILVRHSRVR